MEKRDASINRCLTLLFWRGPLLFFFLHPFEIRVVVVFFPLHTVVLFGLEMLCHFFLLAGFIYLQVLGVRGPGASGTRVEGLTSLEWLCGLNVDPPGVGFTVSTRRSMVL